MDCSAALRPASSPATRSISGCPPEHQPNAENRVLLERDGGIHLHYTPSNLGPHEKLTRRLRHLLEHIGCKLHLLPHNAYFRKRLPIAGTGHQNGTIRFGRDPQSSALDLNCRAHEVDNLYVVDASFFPSSAAVNLTLTIIANALRVGNHLLERLGCGSARQRSARWPSSVAFVSLRASLGRARRLCRRRDCCTGGEPRPPDRFYNGALSFVPSNDAESPAIALQLGEEIIELVQGAARPVPYHSRSNGRRFQHLAIVVSDIDRAYAVVRREGATPISAGPQALPASNPDAGGIRAVSFRDPDGHPLELIQFPPGKGEARW
jgi:catechol 2,3-dioxygenase-like lactoylglutathione lyase family enzyme